VKTLLVQDFLVTVPLGTPSWRSESRPCLYSSAAKTQHEKIKKGRTKIGIILLFFMVRAEYVERAEIATGSSLPSALMKLSLQFKMSMEKDS
jgi:hypothetical protein